MTEITRETVREAVARAISGTPETDDPCVCGRAVTCACLGLADAALSALAALGLAVVPVVPTEAMLRKVRHEDYTSKTDLDWADGWRIMLEAARDGE